MTEITPGSFEALDDRATLDRDGFRRRFWREKSSVRHELPDLTAQNLDDQSFRLLADNLPMLCWIANGDGYIVWYNRRWHDYCGTTPAQMEGWGWRSVHHPDHLPAVMERWTASIAQGEPFEMVFPLKGADGKYRPFLTRVAPVRDGSGQVARWCGVNTEISEQLEAEEALRASEAFNRSILASSADCIKVLDLEGRLEFMSEGGMCVMEVDDFGAIKGACWPDFWLGGERDKALSAVAEAKAGGVGRFQGFATTMKGSPRWWDVIVTSIAGPGGEPARLLSVSRDITASREGEERLRETEERYRLAARATNDAIWDWRMADGHVVWNEALESLFGHARTDSTAQWWLEQIHPEDRDRVDQSIHAVIDGGGEAWIEEYRFRRADGGYASVLDRGAVLRSEAGAPIRMIGAMLDLTERKAAEHQLRVSEARYRALFENIEVGFCIVEMKFDADGQAVDYRLAEINPAFEQQTGLYGGAGKWVSEAAPGLERHWFDTYGEVARTGQSIRFENHAAPFERWYDVYAFPTDGENRVGILFNDITPRKASEARLRELNETLERRVAEATAEREEIWRTSQDLMLVARFDTQIVSVNPAWTAVLGWDDAELVGRSFMDFIHPDDLAASAAEASRLAEDGQTTQKFVNRYRRKDGDYAWLSWAVSSHDERFYGVARDVTAEKLQGEALARAEEALRQSQKMEAVGQLTGGIAHDFNNMLAVVIGSLDLLARRSGEADSRSQRYLEAALEGARRAAMLTQRLLAFSRQQPLKPEPLNANRLVAGMSDLLSHSIGADIRLETVLAAGLWRIHADPNQLESVILNLAVNARDAMPEGGRLTIETQNSHLDERYAASNFAVPPGQYVMIAVTDTGTGMPPEVIAKAFDPFFTTKAVGKGTGLGLSQVYGFVKQSGGHVKIYSEAGEGTTVRVYLPRYLGDEQDGLEPSLRDDLPLGEAQEVVLVVEDEPSVRQFSVDALTELGYRVLEADGAAAALRQIEAEPKIALLFTDIVMPDVNGRKLAEEVLRRRPDLKVLYTTGYTRNAVVHNGVLDPGVELISKPYSIEQLAAKVRAVLDS